MIKIEPANRQHHWSLVSSNQSSAAFTQLNQHDLLTSFQPGWLRIVIKAETSAAKRLIASQGKTSWRPYVRQNTNISRVPMFAERADTLALVIYRDTPLINLELSWLDNDIAPLSEDIKFSLAVKPISTARAWVTMLAKVASSDARQGLPRSQIFRLTRARQKRGGLANALRKLVEAYQPLLSYQLIASDPYDYWLARETFERQPGLPEVVLHSKIPAQAIHIDEHAWYIQLAEEDQLSAQAAIAITQFIAQHCDTLLLYSDHDQLDKYSKRYAPSFKPDWDPELFLANDYIGPALFVRGTLLKRFHPEIKQSTSYRDVQHQAVRALLEMNVNPFTAPTDSCVVGHISEVLYHQHERNLAAFARTEALAIQDAEQVTLTATLAYPTPPEDIELKHSLSIHVKFPLPFNSSLGTDSPDTPVVSIIIPTRDALDITRTCVNSVLQKTEYRDFEIIIVNNDSQQTETLTWFDYISTNPQVRIVDYPYPFNYSAINNFAVERARGDYICLLNNDTEVINADWLGNMLRQSARPEIGCVGAKLYYPDNSIQHAGVVLGLWGLAGHSHKHYLRGEKGYLSRLVSEQNYSAVTAACLLVDKAIFRAVGGLNERELTVAFNDVDLCLKVRQAGYRNVWTPYAELYHYESKTRGSEDTPEKQARERDEVTYMRLHWADIIANDPAYNLNLTRHSEDFNVLLR